jgi:hypothetical protein
MSLSEQKYNFTVDVPFSYNMNFYVLLESVSGITSGSDLTVTGFLDYAQSSKSVTSQDALDALRLSVGMEAQSGTNTAFDYIAADFNQDGKVSSQDALAILK